MELTGKRVIVVGLGKSGVAAARFCHARGARVVATDSARRENLSDAALALPVEIRAGGHHEVHFDSADLVVVSPGVPPLPELEIAENAGAEVIGELELGARFIDIPVVAVGGTNGKSTTTTLLGELLRAGGRRVFVGGNLGTPAVEAVGRGVELCVLEVSSFQLERAPSFHPAVSVLLNVSEDHLDRYPSFLAYAEAKGNAFVNQTSADAAVYPADDSECARQAGRGRGRQVTFGGTGDYAVVARAVVQRSSGESFALEHTELHGAHNATNAAAAIAAARTLGVPVSGVRRGLGEFRALPHRMQRVATVDGVAYYDDSKATNVDAAVTALLGLSEERAVLIAGGRDKGGSYAPLARALADKGRAVVLIGEAAERIAAEVSASSAFSGASSIEEAVRVARKLARPGDAVLLSPACSSFDMFQSYAERGERFAAAVRALRSEMVAVTAAISNSEGGEA
jgi:UDP-N-acetylmuramoylalanine--D-glutamate ligase